MSSPLTQPNEAACTHWSTVSKDYVPPRDLDDDPKRAAAIEEIMRRRGFKLGVSDGSQD